MDEALALGVESGFWKALQQYIDTASTAERMLAINLQEGGVEGKYLYMRGYTLGQRDILRRVELAARNYEALQKKKNNQKEK